MTDTTINDAEIAKFTAMAEEWWNPKGKFKPLHKFNPVRLAYIRDALAARFERDIRSAQPLAGLRLLDIGCGGGLLSEPMSRLGFSVTGVDASERNIGTASTHAAEVGLTVDYRAGTAEALLGSDEPSFDVVLNMEVIEHVADPGAFLRDCARLLAPGGMMIVATLNRTLKALALAKIGAEYVLRWLPPDTHDWRKFLKPEELRAFLAGEDLAVQGPFGVAYNPLADRWNRSVDTDINYMMLVLKPPHPDA